MKFGPKTKLLLYVWDQSRSISPCKT